MDGILIFFFVPMIIFLTIVAPTWILMHYLTAGKRAKTLTEEERDVLDELSETADKIEARITTLEKILDAEDPKWRTRQ